MAQQQRQLSARERVGEVLGGSWLMMLTSGYCVLGCCPACCVVCFCQDDHPYLEEYCNKLDNFGRATDRIEAGYLGWNWQPVIAPAPPPPPLSPAPTEADFETPTTQQRMFDGR